MPRLSTTISRSNGWRSVADAPAWEPELGKRTRRRIKPMPLPEMGQRIIPLYSLDERNRVIRTTYFGRVVPTAAFTGTAGYVIQWKGNAIAVCCIEREGLIAVRVTTPSRMIATWGASELEPHILGRIVGLAERAEELA